MRRLLALAPVVLALGLGVAGCSSDDAGGDAVPITATNTECRVGSSTLTAGKHTFRVENAGSDATEVYVYAAGDKVVAEKENVGPGTKASFSATLDPGTYQVACKPGQKGSGIRQTLTVT